MSSVSLKVNKEVYVNNRIDLEILLSRRIDIHKRIAVLANLGMGIQFLNSCPNCHHELSLEEVLKGFNLNKVYEIKTQCPKCGELFEANIEFNHLAYNDSYTFYCETQALQELEDEYNNSSPKEILENNPGLFISSLVHFGTIPSAFKHMDEEYPWSQKYKNWKETALKFLSTLPAKVLAETLGVSISSIYRLKKSAK